MGVTHTFVSAIADDPAAVSAGEVVPSHWNATHTITSLDVVGGTVTASTPLFDGTQTWNNAAVTFYGFKINITDTTSDAVSKVVELNVGGSPILSLQKNGIFRVNYALIGGGDGGVAMNYYNNGQRWFSSAELSWTNGASHGDTVDLSLFRDTSATLAQRNGTNGQTSRVYGTYTDASNHVRAALSATSTAVTLAAETAGTGADNVPVNITPAGTEGVVVGNYIQMAEMTAPGAAPANGVRIYAVDNGSGKTRLMAIFPSGAAQQIAIEP